ncbi:MAG: hypothetical protein HY763_13215 [Planctomycetes bacterium]|nr:hypothetical protein [Planctomycetota bacterium]
MSQFLRYSLPEHLRARRSAQRREVGVQVAAVVTALLCLAGAGMLLAPMNAVRRERQLVVDPDTIKGLPPGMSLLGKLGTFRALAIDWASIRAERLKQEGKTYEAYELHKTICKLAPRFPRVWATAAWNMAYNISVNQYTPEARWQWVRNGIALLRDEGIPYNPRSITLYRELQWIFWHKIGDFLDDEHLNYKRALAVEMERVLGPPPVTLSDAEYFDWFRKIVDAPRDVTALIEGDAEVSRLVSRLIDLKLGPDDSLLEFVARHLRPELDAGTLVKDQQQADPLPAQRLAVLKDPAYAEALDRLLAALRSRVLRERYKMNLEWMLDLMVNQYGPLDWRNAFAHSLYWSSWGNKANEGYEYTDRADEVNTARNMFFALHSLIVRGRMVLLPDFDDPFASYIDFTSDLRFIPYLFNTYLRIGKEQFGGSPDFVEGTPGKNYMTGLVTNMENWIQMLFLEGGEENAAQAENFYAWLREYNRHPDGTVQSRYQKTLEQFVMDDILAQLDTYRAVNGLIRAQVVRGLKHLQLGQKAACLAAFERARLAYEYWMHDSRVDPNDRRKMQPFVVIVRDEIVEFLRAAYIAPLFKVRLWRELPLEQRQMSYDLLTAYFHELCAAQQPPWSVELAFDEPPGMEEARKRDLELRGAPRQEGVDPGEKFKP